MKMAIANRIKEYFSLMKGGLVLGNIIPVIAGFALAAQGGRFNGGLFLATLVGIFLVMASGCVFNNYIDRDIDKLMERTSARALAQQRIPAEKAFWFAATLGIVGFFVLAVWTNVLATAFAALGFFFYVVVYTIWFKRRSVYGTVVGAIAGAAPPVVGYCAVSDRFDVAALILFLIMMTWQMPHFFAIAIRRQDEYAAAGIPVMPVRYGIQRTKISMLIYIVEFIIATLLLLIFGYAGVAYLAVALVFGSAWFAFAIRGLSISDPSANKRWARGMFFLSLIVMVVLFTSIGLQGF